MINMIVETKHLGALFHLAERMPSITDFMENQVAESFREHLVRTQMSGQTLGRRTGKTAGSVRQWRDKRGGWSIRPGVGISGSLNYLQGPHFEGGARPFTMRAVQSFAASREASKITARIFNAMMKRIFGEVA